MVALGNFDGVHRGHQAVLTRAAQMADGLGVPLAACVFSPHPRRFFAPDKPAFRLMSDAWRVAALGDFGVERVYEIPFDRDLSLMSAEEFARCVLRDGLGVCGVVVGFDYRFGKDRTGDEAALCALGTSLGFDVAVQERQDIDGSNQKFSSSAVRRCLRDGDPLGAADILSRPWVIDGVVIRGDQRGRTIGFPTANLALGHLVRPQYGVYAVGVRVRGEHEWRCGVANIGRRPTVDGEHERLEVHVFDFEGDLYGRTLDVALGAFLRPEQVFSGLDALVAQIGRDCDAARHWLGDAGAVWPQIVV